MIVEPLFSCASLKIHFFTDASYRPVVLQNLRDFLNILDPQFLGLPFQQPNKHLLSGTDDLGI
jgi:hypothetical protein